MSSPMMSTRTFFHSLLVVAAFAALSQCECFQCSYTRTLSRHRKFELYSLNDEAVMSSKAESDGHHQHNLSPRRQFVQTIIGSTSVASFLVFGISSKAALAASGADTVVDTLNVQDYMRRGTSVSPMGVSGQAGKSRPETGVILRDGSIPSRDEKSGSVLAEILLDDSNQQPVAVLASFISPWPIATGSVFDVECRNSKTGDGAFLAVSKSTKGTLAVKDLPDSFFLQNLFQPTGRFSFYGAPTDIKSTNSEIPRNAIVKATIPKGTQNVVMLVASASASRWRKGADAAARGTIDSFRAVPAPKSNLKIRPRDRFNSNADMSITM